MDDRSPSVDKIDTYISYDAGFKFRDAANKISSFGNSAPFKQIKTPRENEKLKYDPTSKKDKYDY